MGTEFLRLKRKHTTWRLMRSVMLGLSVGLLLTGILLVIFKLTGTNAHAPLCIGVGAVAAIAAAVAQWLVMRRTDLLAAEQIDSEHQMRERVQTMIAFRDEDSAMLQMQRQDTEDRLKAVKSYGIRGGTVAMHIGALVLAVAIFITGAVLPARAEVIIPEPTEPDYDATAWQIASLEALIEHVEQSNMTQVAKDATVVDLQALRQILDTSITVSAFKGEVIKTITNVYTYTDRANSNDDLHDAVRAVDHELSGNLSYVVGSLDNVAFNADVEDIGYQLGLDINLPHTGALAQGLREQLAKIVSEYMPENDYDETDMLYLAMVRFAAGMQELAELIAADAAEAEINGKLGEVVHTMKAEVSVALEQQTETKKECVYVVENLCSIFSISPSECPRDPDPAYSKDGSNDETGEGAAPGSGEMQYAGDEQVYDYKNNQYTSYTELLDEYYAAMLQANLEGRLSDEMVEFILKYFSQLYTG